VRAVSGNKKGGEAFSAPIVLSDTAPPTAKVEANTEPGKNAGLRIEASDNVALDHYVVWWKERFASDDELWVVTDGMLSGKEAQANPAISLPHETYGQAITLAVDVVDSGWNTGRGWLNAVVGQDGTVTFPPQSPIDPPDPSLAPPDGDGRLASSCAAGGSGNAPAWGGFMLAALFGAVLRQSARRRAKPSRPEVCRRQASTTHSRCE
jgi:MYXO-CTERM domain-containing protein